MQRWLNKKKNHSRHQKQQPPISVQDNSQQRNQQETPESAFETRWRETRFTHEAHD